MAVVLLIKTVDGSVSDLPLLNKVVIGRSSTSDFKIADTKLSGIHCSFELTNKGQVVFKDLGSTNGSFLNNAQVQEVHLRINDVIRVGDTHIRIDEKRLSPSDRTAIGVSNVKRTEEKTLPEMTRAMKRKEEEKLAKEKNPGSSDKKKGIGLSTKIREAKVRDKEARQDEKIKWAKNIVEAEQSSGNTQALKLDDELKKKKK